MDERDWPVNEQPKDTFQLIKDSLQAQWHERNGHNFTGFVLDKLAELKYAIKMPTKTEAANSKVNIAKSQDGNTHIILELNGTKVHLVLFSEVDDGVECLVTLYKDGGILLDNHGTLKDICKKINEIIK